jgi:hypothetical protein
LQELEEPGQDTSRYDMLSPAVVKPKLRVYNVSECRKTRVCNHFGEHITLNNSKIISGQFEILIPGDVIYSFAVFCVTRVTADYTAM